MPLHGLLSSSPHDLLVELDYSAGNYTLNGIHIINKSDASNSVVNQIIEDNYVVLTFELYDSGDNLIASSYSNSTGNLIDSDGTNITSGYSYSNNLILDSSNVYANSVTLDGVLIKPTTPPNVTQGTAGSPATNAYYVKVLYNSSEIIRYNFSFDMTYNTQNAIVTLNNQSINITSISAAAALTLSLSSQNILTANDISTTIINDTTVSISNTPQVVSSSLFTINPTYESYFEIQVTYADLEGIANTYIGSVSDLTVKILSFSIEGTGNSSQGELQTPVTYDISPDIEHNIIQTISGVATKYSTTGATIVNTATNAQLGQTFSKSIVAGNIFHYLTIPQNFTINVSFEVSGQGPNIARNTLYIIDKKYNIQVRSQKQNLMLIVFSMIFAMMAFGVLKM